ncbi:polyphenol oxidase family protein [Demequina iriomotensis]|uniref:polyphenol oxidase family protein n=1 Tax=Demequina iriomotensis TaxID=1536641 RepID=UPI0007806022|nr:polyphenol oxidase family protein [Demequina iriomotensis]
MLDAGLPVRAFFTARAGGASALPYGTLNVATHVGDAPEAVARNRAAVSVLAGAPVSFLNAEHGIRVAEVTRPGEEPAVADVLVTRTPGVALGAIAADCMPILMHDAVTGAVAAIHSGREGVRRGAVDAAVAALLDMRTPQQRRRRDGLAASIGPAICGRCYEVPAAMREEVAHRHPTARSATGAGTPALDLPRAAETRLGELGFAAVVRHRVCTYEDERYFSHRRDGVTGRHAGVIVCGVSVR